MFFRFATAAALAATASMAAAPLAAAELPRFATPVGISDADSVNAQNHRRWRRDRVDAGDVIGGLLVIGTIAAVASAASKASRNDRYRDRDYRYPGGDYRYDYRNRPTGSGWNDNRGLDRAVDMCAREVERNARIDSVDNVNRTGAGWRVSGQLRTGEPFTCSIGPDGRIEAVDYGARGAAADGQWSDDRYAAARSAQDAAGEPVPPYPGGPIVEEEVSEVPADDGRYQTAQAPDFPG